MYLAHPKTPRREVANMTRLLLEFAENTPEGKKFMADTGHLGLRPPSTREMKSLDPYVSDLKTLLGKR
jgi:phosphonate transport system substrate-binding protein